MMPLNILSRGFPTLLILSLTSPPASGKPLPPGTANPSPKIEARSSSDGGLQTWEIIVIVLGSFIGIILIGGLGGACEVMLHTRSKIVRSNAEADAKVEGGSRAMELEAGEEKDGETGSDAATEVDEDDPSHFSWQPEKMTTGKDMPEDRTLSRAHTDDSSQTTLNGEQGADDGAEEPMHDVHLDWEIPAAEPIDSDFYQEQTRDRIIPWEDQTHPDPALSQFVIGDDEDSPDHEGEEAADYDHDHNHHVEQVAMPDEADFQPANAGYEPQEDAWHHEADSNQSEESPEPAHDHIGEALAVAPVGDYSGEGYSPAAMPDEADYLADYRQSQLYLQQEDDWQQYYGSSNGASEMDHEHEGHQTQGNVVPQPEAGYF